MWEMARAKLRDWYIVVIALLLFGGGFFLASHPWSSTAPAAIHTASPSPTPETAAAPPPPEHQHQKATAATAATSTAASHPPPTVPIVAPKATQPAPQPSSSEEHTAVDAMSAAEPRAQPPTAGGAVTAPLASGDAAAGRLVFRKCQACHSIIRARRFLVLRLPASSAAKRAPRPITTTHLR
jgi:nitrite reductase (NO-forming)